MHPAIAPYALHREHRERCDSDQRDAADGELSRATCRRAVGWGVSTSRSYERLDHLQQVAGSLVPVGRLLLQALHHDLCDRGRHVGLHARQRLGCPADLRRHHGLRRPGKRRPPRQHLISQDANRIDVGAMIGTRVGGSLLRRHVCRSAERDTDAREPRRPPGLAHGLGDAEVHDHGVPFGDHDVVRLDVAMDDVVAVGVREGIHHVAQQTHRLGRGERSFLHEPGAQRVALDEGHDVVEQPVGFA